MTTGEVILGIVAAICATLSVLGYASIRYGKPTNDKENSK